jgi:hypothetical protein
MVVNQKVLRVVKRIKCQDGMKKANHKSRAFEKTLKINNKGGGLTTLFFIVRIALLRLKDK